MTEKSHVSMGQHICPICLSVFDSGEILLDKRLKDSLERYTITGQSICKTCTDHIENNKIALIIVPVGYTIQNRPLHEVPRAINGTIFVDREELQSKITIDIMEESMVMIDLMTAEQLIDLEAFENV